ncbi:hypothetical protein K2X30_05175 [bacterium]|nr:hypothetical protein [bacterium]
MNNKTGLILICVLTMTSTAHAMGRRKPAPAPAPAPSSAPAPVPAPITTAPGLFPAATPVREVVLMPVGNQVFTLPDGKQADLNDDLNTIFQTSVIQTGRFAPYLEGSSDVCRQDVKVVAKVSSFMLEGTQLQIRFGYNNQGELNQTGPTLEGVYKMKVGEIAIDFHVYQCHLNQMQTGQYEQLCVGKAAASVSNKLVSQNLEIDVTFGLANIGVSMLRDTALGALVRKMMDTGLNQVANSAAFHELSWKAKVREYDPATGMITFDAGTQQRILPNQGFEIYEVTPSTAACDVYKTVAYAHTVEVDSVSSVAKIDTFKGNHKTIQPGSIVMVHVP